MTTNDQDVNDFEKGSKQTPGTSDDVKAFESGGRSGTAHRSSGNGKSDEEWAELSKKFYEALDASKNDPDPTNIDKFKTVTEAAEAFRDHLDSRLHNKDKDKNISISRYGLEVKGIDDSIKAMVRSNREKAYNAFHDVAMTAAHAEPQDMEKDIDAVVEADKKYTAYLDRMHNAKYITDDEFNEAWTNVKVDRKAVQEKQAHLIELQKEKEATAAATGGAVGGGARRPPAVPAGPPKPEAHISDHEALVYWFLRSHGDNEYIAPNAEVQADRAGEKRILSEQELETKFVEAYKQKYQNVSGYKPITNQEELHAVLKGIRQHYAGDDVEKHPPQATLPQDAYNQSGQGFGEGASQQSLSSDGIIRQGLMAQHQSLVALERQKGIPVATLNALQEADARIVASIKELMVSAQQSPPETHSEQGANLTKALYHQRYESAEASGVSSPSTFTVPGETSTPAKNIRYV